MQTSQKLDFPGAKGATLSARLDLPAGPIRAYAIFAHCFTCSKDLHATRSIAAELSGRGLAVLRFDFTGLGNSSGDFASTNFSSNREDLIIAADYLRTHYKAPSLLIGHSLGGAAVLSVAGEIPEIKAVVTLGAPAEASHVIHNFGAKIDEISEAGEAEVMLGGRKFSIRKQFLDDLASNDVLKRVAALKKPLLVLHSPLDQTVGIENATQIFAAAKHPKSFVSLDNADHLLSSASDARFAAAIIASWSERYVSRVAEQNAGEISGIARISETGNGKFQNTISVNGHHAVVDEPVGVGGLDSGMSPYDLLAASLGSCTSMTLRMYADFKKIDLGRISVDISHTKTHAKDCVECAQERREAGGKIDVFERRISVEGLDDPAIKAKLVEIADKCPVHRTLEKGAVVKTAYEPE